MLAGLSGSSQAHLRHCTAGCMCKSLSHIQCSRGGTGLHLCNRLKKYMFKTFVNYGTENPHSLSMTYNIMFDLKIKVGDFC